MAPKARLQTAVRQLSAQELNALKVENERLLKLEQALIERERELRLREESVGEEVGMLKAEICMLRERIVDGRPGAEDADASGRVVAASKLNELESQVALERSEAEDRLEKMKAARDDGLKRAQDAERERQRLADRIVHHKLQLSGRDVELRVLRGCLRDADAELRVGLSAISQSEAWLKACGEEAGTQHGQEHVAASTCLTTELRELEQQTRADVDALTAQFLAVREANAVQLEAAQSQQRQLTAAAHEARDAASEAAAARQLAEQAAEGHASRAASSAAEVTRLGEALAKCDAALKAAQREAQAAQNGAAQLAAQAVAEATASAQAKLVAVASEHERAQLEASQRFKEAARVREGLLKQAIGRAEQARAAQEDAEAQAEAAADAEQAAQEHAELLTSQMKRLERRLEKEGAETRHLEDKCQALARRLEALAAAGTESHANDMGYWVERSKRDTFAHSAFTVGTTKRLTKAAKTARIKAAAGSTGIGRSDATAPAADGADEASRGAATKLPPL